MLDVHLLKSSVWDNYNLRMPTKQVSADGAEGRELQLDTLTELNDPNDNLL